MDGRLVFDLGQKWAKGLRLCFPTQAESAALDGRDGDRLKQVHGKKLVAWSPHQAKIGYQDCEADGFLARGDAFKKARRKLYIRTADCAPLFYVDRENECLAAIHAGWRGLAQGIHLTPFDKDFDPKTTWIWCGPCLNGASFEVGEDMWSQFEREDQQNFFVNSVDGKSAAPGKKFFNAWNFLDAGFKKIGVELFYNVQVDTFTTPAYASYRRWKKEGSVPAKLQHNHSWCGFL